MGLFDFLKKGKPQEAKSREQIPLTESYIKISLSDENLVVLIQKAIAVFENYPALDWVQIKDKIKEQCDDEDLALALYRFIPIAFCRLFIPEPIYSDTYILYKSATDQASFFFSKDKLYQMILSESGKRISKGGGNILSILNHSADFNAINQALNKGSELKNLMTSPSYFM